MLVLKTDGGVVVRGGVPQTTAGDLDALIFHLSDSDLHDGLVTRDVHHRDALLLDLICNAHAQRLVERGGEYARNRGWVENGVLMRIHSVFWGRTSNA